VTFLEIVREIVLPSVGALAALGGLIMFIGSRQQRQAETRKTDAETEQIVQLTVGNLHQMTTDAAAQALEAQRGLIDNLQEEIRQTRAQAQEEIKQIRAQATDFECKLNDRDRKIRELEAKVNRLEKELGVREQNIVALEAKLERYEIENERLSQENKVLKRQVESQRKRIKELETQLSAIKKKLEEDNG
jgi:chromosome segregation ATPase